MRLPLAVRLRSIPLLFVVLAPACATSIQNVPVSVHGLLTGFPSQRPRPSLGVIVEGVTPDNAAQHGDLIKHVTWSVTTM